MGMVYTCVCADRDKKNLESTFEESQSPKYLGKFKQVSTPMSKENCLSTSD